MRSACTAPERMLTAQQMVPPESMPTVQQMLAPERMPTAQQMVHAEVRSDAGCAENAACTAKDTGRVGKASGVRPRGEYVLVIDGRNPEELAQKKAAAWETMDIAAHVALYEQKGMGRKEAMKAAARDRGLSRRDIYQALLHSPESENKTE